MKLLSKLLSEEFLAQYPDMPEHMTPMASFVFYRTYSRWLPNLNRRETWREAVARAVEYNVSITSKVFKNNKFTMPIDSVQQEAQVLFDNVFNLRQFLSGRTHWVGGAKSGVADKFPLANFNCSFINVTKWDDLCDLFYLLLVGTGVGIRCSKANAKKLPPVRIDYNLTHSEYKPLPKAERIEKTKTNIMDNGYAKIYIGDSKSGWIEALRIFLQLITEDKYAHIKHIKISYNSIRPKGERLLTFGGTASGHEPIREMFEGIDKVLKGTLDPSIAPPEAPQANTFKGDDITQWRVVRPIHVLDMCNLIGNNVVCGGVRRTAEMFICDSDDEEVISAKRNITSATAHRFMSNNSIAFEEKPTREELHKLFENIKLNGEPGFINMQAAKKRRPNMVGLNPCGEVLLDSYGVCNLTTVNVKAFVNIEDGVPVLDYQGLMQAQALSTRAGIRMTCIDLELPHWNEVHKRDRLVGCSLTGWKDAMDMLGYDEEREAQLLSLLSDVAYDTAIKYCSVLRIPTPLLITTVKPEGTLSQVANGVSSGLHISYAPYYIRRIRINESDALVEVARQLGWRMEECAPQTYAIEFPVRSNATRTRAEQTVKEQFDTYFMFQDFYTAHNSSITITVKDDEWDEAEQIVWDRWDDFIGVTFLPYDTNTYEHMPYEEITEEEYNQRVAEMKPFDVALLYQVEGNEMTATEEGIESCESGICPVR